MECRVNTRKCGVCLTITDKCTRSKCDEEHIEFIDKTMRCTHVPENITDWRGTPINVGDHIVYPGRGSSALWMTESVVKAFKHNEPSYYQQCATYTLMVEPLNTTRFTFDDGTPKKPRLYSVGPGLVTVVPKA